jgi:hypothetical protein
MMARTRMMAPAMKMTTATVPAFLSRPSWRDRSPAIIECVCVAIRLSPVGGWRKRGYWAAVESKQVVVVDLDAMQGNEENGDE